MRNRVNCAIILLAITLFQVFPGFAQDNPRRDLDPIIIPEGQTEVEYSRAEDMPRQLQKAFFDKCGREQSEYLKNFPARIIKPKPKSRIIALVPCGRIMIGGRAFVFDRGQPVPISFTVISPSRGFTATEDPGFLGWHAESLMLTATRGTDMIDCQSERPHQVKHTYSYVDHNYPASPFTLTKVEAMAELCGARGKDESNTRSVTLWEAPVWLDKWKE